MLTMAVSETEVHHSQWHCWALIFKRTGNNYEFHLYLDGTKEGSKTWTYNGDPTGPQELSLGNYANPVDQTRSGNVTMDELLIFNSALTDAEIQSICNNI